MGRLFLEIMMKNGLSLWEFLTVILILVAIGAFAIPMLFSSKITRCGNTPAVSLKSLSATQATWYTSDTDRNGVKDYWMADISGFYRVLNAGGNPVANIDISFAKSDYNPVAAGAGTPTVDVAVVTVANTPQPKSGYYFAAFINDENGKPYRQDLNGDGSAYENASKYAFMCFPEKYGSTGMMSFIISEAGTIYKIESITTENVGGRNAGRSFNTPKTGAPSAMAPILSITDWPSINPMDCGYAAHA